MPMMSHATAGDGDPMPNEWSKLCGDDKRWREGTEDQAGR
jgi:hypothetical protein